MPKYISGRYKKTPQSGLSSDRYRYLSPGDAEPNLGDSPSNQGSPNLPTGQQFIVVSFIDRPGERFWIPNQGGLIPGSLSIFEESQLVGGLSSTTQLNFIGQSITAEGVGGSNPGVAVTITVAPPGNLNEVLFVGAGGTDFDTDTRFTFNNGLFAAGDRITVGTGGTVITTTGIGSVGIGTTNPTQKLHLNGDFRITGTIYDSLNEPGDTGDLIVKTATGGLSWVAPKSVTSGAGGTIGQIQYHNTAGLVDGASNFYYDFNNNRVGIGSTQPTQLLDVLGVSTFKGGVFVDDLHTGTLNVSGVSTIPTISGIVTFNNQTNNIIGNSNTGAVQIDGGVGIDKNLTVGAAITTQNLGVSGIATVQTLDVDTIDIENLNVAGISTLGNVVVNTNTISTKSGTGNLIIDSDASVNIKDPLIVSGQTESTNKDNGSLVVEGGIGVEKSVNIGLNLDVDGNTELDTLNVSIASTTASLTVGTGVAVTTILDEDDMSSNSDTALATQQSIKTYIDNQTTAQDLDFAGDSGSGSVDLDSQTFTISGTTNEIETTGSNQTLTIGLPDNVTVSGNLTVNGNTTLGNADTDTVVFNAEVDSDIIPDDDNTYDLGSSIKKWANVYATTFNGAFQGNADTADKLTTPRQISFSEDVVSIAKTFDGSADVGFALTLANSGVTSGTYGSSTQVGTVTVDSKGRVTAASNVNINFADATVDIAKKLETARTFTLGEGNSDDIVSIAKTFDGSADVGFALTLKDVGPGAGTYGGDNKLISLALDDKGRVTGVTSTSINFGIANVATADSLSNSRNIAATGDITWNVNFKGHENVTAAATLSNTTVSAGSYGSPTQVGTFTVDTKGRLTAAGNTSINFADATVGNANYADNAGIATNLKGGDAYQIPYQSAANTTQFIPNGSVTGQLLQYNQSSAPSWVSVGEISAGTASTANNLSGGAAGSIPYQTGPGITAFLGEPDADDKVLSYNNSTNAPVWVNSSTIGTDNYVDGVSFAGNTLTLSRTGSLTDLTTTITLAGIGGTDKFTGLTDTPSNYTSAGGKLVAVNSGADALEFIDVSGVGTDNYVDSVSFSGGTLTLGRTGSLTDLTTTISLAGIGGTNAFTGLTDTPADYTNQGGKLVAVNSGADALEFIDAPGVGTSYTLPASGNTSSVTITLTGSDSSTDPVTITAGTGVSFANVSQSGFTINSSGGGGSSDPVGTIVAWAGSVASIPSEYQLCDGSAAQTTELQAITGANVPDLRSRFIVGASDVTGEGTWPSVGVGSTGGSSESTLPSHRHIYPGDDHLAFANGKAGWTGGVNNNNTYADTFSMDADSQGSGDGRMWYTTYAGSDDTNTNLPPYYALCYIIKHTATSSSGGSPGVGIGSTTRIIQGNTKAEVVDTGSDGHFFVETEGTERLRVTSNGSVGIGTTNPTATLDVNGKVALGSSVYDSNGNTGTSGQVLSSVPGIGVSWTDQTGGSGGSGSGTTKVAILSDVKTAGTNGGDFDSGEWRNRELNTELDPESFVTLNSSNNYFELGEGSYRISWSAPAHAVDMHQTRLTYANNTSFTSSSEVYGTSEACFDPVLEGSNNIQTRSFGETIITITETTYFKIQHRCQDDKSGSGFGLSKDFGSEGTNEAIYTQVIIQDLNSGGGSGGSGGSSDSVGTIVAWSGSFSSIPSEYQLCDGSAAQTTELQAITGANVPDLRSRFIVGAANTTGIGTYPNVGLGSTGGSADSVVVSHTHNVNNQTGTGPQWIAFSRNDIDPTPGTEGNDNTGYLSGTGSVGNDRIFDIESQGEDAENKNLPPYYALFYIIKHTATSGSGGIELLSPKTATGTSVEFTDIPADAKEITLMFSEVGVGNTTNHLLVQLGTSSGWINTGYYASSEAENGNTDVSASDGFPIHNKNVTDSAGNRFTGSMIINLFKTSPSKTYTQIGQFKRYNSSNDCEDCSSACQTYGNVDSISGDITRIRVLANHTGSGQSFTNGEINVSCNSGGSGGGSGSGSGFVLQTAKSSATENSNPIEFTDIPEDAYEITLMFNEVSLSGDNEFLIQLGTSSSYIETGYTATSQSEGGSNHEDDNTAFIIYNGSGGDSHCGKFDINKFSDTAYTFEGQTRSTTSSGSQAYGVLNGVSGTITRLRIKPSGSNNFDAGSINISYKTASSGGSGGGSGSGSGSGFVLLPAQTIDSAAEESSVEFTDIPEDAYEMTLMFEGVSGSSNADLDVQLGTSSGYITSNYDSSSETAQGTAESASTTSFKILSDASTSLHGSMIINKSSSNSYSQIGQFKLNDTSACDCYGSLSSVSGVVDRLKVSISSGYLDAGLIGLSYKTASSGGSGGVGIGSTTKIIQGNTKAEVVDTGSDGHFLVETEGTERLRVTSNGSVGIGTSVPNDPVTSSNTAKLAVGIVTCHELYVNGTQITGSGSGGGSGGTTKVAVLSDVKSPGTAGGTFTSGSWIDRTLNTEVDPESFVTFSSSNDYFALESGTYKINWSAPGYNTGEHKTQLVYANNTSFTSPTNIQGSSEFDSSLTEPNTQTRSFGETVVTITETTYFKLQHRAATTQDDNGFGLESNFGVDEVYSQIVVQDLSSASSSGGGGITIQDEGSDLSNEATTLNFVGAGVTTSGTGTTKTITIDGGGGITLLPAQTIDSAAQVTSVEFTSIPADALEMTLMFEGVSGSTNTDFDVQLGTSSGYIASNYNSSSEKAEGTNSSNSTSSFVIRNKDATFSFHGSMIINKSSSNSYVETGQFKRSNDAACECFGSLSSVSGVVDRLKVSISSGHFNAGLISLSYKTSGSGGGGFVTGMIMMFSGTTAPSGWVLCDNSAEAQAANAPDLRDRFIVGASIGGNTTYPGVGIGSTGGSANAVLIGHSHGTYGDESGYRHPVRRGQDGGIDWHSHTANSNDATYESDSRTDAAGVDNVGIASTTQTGTNANLPPYYALAFIMKT